MTTLGERLREARGSLGLSQTDFAAIGGVQKRAQINYEQDARAPDAAYLKAIADHGVDVRYIVTGERLAPGEIELERRLRLVRDATAAAIAIAGLSTKQQSQVQAAIFQASMESLRDDEQQLLKHYRAADAAMKPAILAAAASLAVNGPHAHSPPKPAKGPKVQQNFNHTVDQVAAGNIINKDRRGR
jgi:transcriptional regulator with XRE-family HTH domain